MKLEDFGRLQRKLAVLFKGDPAVCDLPRVLRLPGAWHQKGEPFQTRILSIEETPTAYSLEDFETALADVEDPDPKSGSKETIERKPRSQLRAPEWVNQEALARIRDWAPLAFPGGYRSGASYRVPPKALSRGCQETLSIHPNGIQDWGQRFEEKKVGYTPVGVLQAFFDDVAEDGELVPAAADYGDEWQPCGTLPADKACEWLAERLGMNWQKLLEEDDAKGPNGFEPSDAGDQGGDRQEPRCWIQSSREFVEGFTPPDYLIDRVLQRGYLYALTGNTGSGKTAVAMTVAVHVGEGRQLHRLEVARGRVLYLAGENDIDVRMRWIAMAEHLGFDVNDIDVHFLPGARNVTAIKKKIDAAVEQLGEVVLVVVDTSAAFYAAAGGDDENDNVQMLKHAKMLRSLTEIAGRPTVLVLCHPTKHAAADNLLPRGGGSFLAEIDGNLT